MRGVNKFMEVGAWHDMALRCSRKDAQRMSDVARGEILFLSLTLIANLPVVSF